MADTAFDPDVPPSMLFGRGNELVAPEPPPQEPPPGPPSQGDQPRAFEPGWMPPVQQAQVTPGVGAPQQPQVAPFDEEQEENIRVQQEEELRNRQLLDHETGKPLKVPGLLQMDDFQRAQIKEMRDLANSLPDRKRADLWTKRANDLEGKIKSDLARQNAQLHREYVTREREVRRRADYPQKTPQQRETDAAIMDAAFDTVYGTTIKPELESDDPQRKINGDYYQRVTPLTTMSRPKAGEDPTVAAARNKSALIGLAQNVAVMNPKVQPDQVINYLMAIGQPIDIRQDPQTRGFNQLRGKAGTNYQVMPGHDAGENWMLRMPDGRVIRVDDVTKKTLDRARQIGWVQQQKWIAEQKQKQDQPDLIERGYRAIFGPRVPAPAGP
jgi:hypothetical protein